MNKYGNKKVVIDGIEFMSRKEGNRYRELKLLQRAKVIENLQLQPRFELQPSFKKNGKTYRKIEYVGDFMYKENGHVIVEDTKGMETDVFKLKHKMFEYKYPGLELKIL